MALRSGTLVAERWDMRKAIHLADWLAGLSDTMALLRADLMDTRRAGL